MFAAEFASIFFGLASAFCYGSGDFSGGLATKRSPVYAVIIASQIVGVALLFLLALAFAQPIPPLEQLMIAGVAGLVGAVGLAALYQALASSPMGVASPVAAVISAAVPILFSAISQGLPGTLKLAGFAVALAAIWLISRSKATRLRFSELRLPILAGLGFGFFFILINSVSAVSVLWPLVAARLASLAFLTGLTVVIRQPRLPTTGVLPVTALAGLMDAGGNAFFVLAAQNGALDIAAILSSLYPAVTVLLSWIVLKEHLSRTQVVGVVLALGAILLIVA